MKHLHTLLVVLAVAIFPELQLSAQCEPDTVNCKDTGEPGQICPPNLPDAVLNEAYEEIITVLAPDTATVSVGGVEVPIGLVYITVDSVNNLPSGIQYEANAEIFYPDSAYCILVSGTPTEAGTFQLKIKVSAYVNVGAGLVVKGGEFTDSTSVSITVKGTSSIDPYKVHEFQVLPSAPNPFSETTRLGIYTPFDEHVKLQVYNILGKLMHEEVQGVPPGEHYFEFSGSELEPGTYFYRVTNSQELFTGKCIKSR